LGCCAPRECPQRQHDLAALYCVSRPVIREALRRHIKGSYDRLFEGKVLDLSL